MSCNITDITVDITPTWSGTNLDSNITDSDSGFDVTMGTFAGTSRTGDAVTISAEFLQTMSAASFDITCSTGHSGYDDSDTVSVTYPGL